MFRWWVYDTALHPMLGASVTEVVKLFSCADDEGDMGNGYYEED